MNAQLDEHSNAQVRGCTGARINEDAAMFSVRGRPSARSKFLGVPRANSAPSAKGKVLKNILKTFGFLKFSARGPPSARSKFLGVPRANSANAREQILRKPSKRIPFGFLGYPPGGFNEDRKGN